TELDDILKGMEADTLILCGVCTNICVFLTAVDAVQRGYKVIIHSNQVASFDMEAHEYTLNQLENVFGVEVR
ncbi:MAG TPA: isochorismatase family cysteine hydrolase, partial [Methanosarcinales archaeon]|nr:isochorismatase family cysteine hydrolase [Methanosarcinales archaeon]